MTRASRALAAAVLLLAAPARPATDSRAPGAEADTAIRTRDAAPPAAAPEERIRALLAVTGLESRVRQLPTLISSQVNAAMGGSTGRGSDELARMLGERVDGNAALDRVARALAADLAPASVEALLAWFAEPPGDRVAAAIAMANAPEGQGQYDAYARRLAASEPSRARRLAAARIEAASGASRILTILQGRVNLALVNALDRILGVDRGSEETQARLAQAIGAQIGRSIQSQSRVFVLFAMRTLRGDQVDAYVAFSEGADARRFHEIAYREMLGAGLDALAEFQTRFDAWLAQTDVAARAAAMREEGAAWGAVRQDGECLEEVFRRDPRCPDLICEVTLADFAAGCLSAARASAAFCRDVPPVAGDAGAGWRAKRCRAMSRADRVCVHLMESAQRHCESAPAPGG